MTHKDLDDLLARLDKFSGQQIYIDAAAADRDWETNDPSFLALRCALANR